MAITFLHSPRLFNEASGWRPPQDDFNAVVKRTCGYLVIALLLCIPILLSCAEIAAARHAPKSPLGKAIFSASEEGICVNLDGCGGP
jgi:hypothetical protein